MATTTEFNPLLKKNFQELNDETEEFERVDNTLTSLQNSITALNTLLSSFEKDENGNYIFEIPTKFLQDVTILGTQHVVETEEVTSQNDYIILRQNNPLGLSPGTYSGFKITNYDGNNTNCLLVVDANGWARVGDENGNVQKLATIEETPTGGKFVKYNTTNKELETSDISYNELTDKPAEATTSAAGLMSAADKTKLDGIATGANKYSLPTASASTLGGVKVGTNLSISSGVLSATDTTYSAATTSAAGLMSAADKTKLDGIATNANKYSLPTASASTLGGVKVGTNLSISSGVLSATNTTYTNFVKSGSTAAAGLVPAPSTTAGTAKYLREDATWATPPNTTYSAATTSAAGLMSAADKTKLDGIATGANKYSLPTASA